MKFKNFLFKSTPYILSVLGGMLVYIISVDLINDGNLNDLLSNVAASLLAIPLIFVLYEYVNYKMSNSLNDKMAESLTFDVNSIVLKVLKTLRDILAKNRPLDWNFIQKMLRFRAKEIKAKAKVSKTDIELLRSYKKDLNELTYKLVRSGILPNTQVQQVITITKELAHTVNEWNYKGNTQLLSKYIENLLEAIDDWFDSCERESLKSHQQFQLTIDKEAESFTPTKRKKSKKI